MTVRVNTPRRGDIARPVGSLGRIQQISIEALARQQLRAALAATNGRAADTVAEEDSTFLFTVAKYRD